MDLLIDYFFIKGIENMQFYYRLIKLSIDRIFDVKEKAWLIDI